ncbi:class I SAM-dependent methyltransferase [Raoultella sp. BIGb0138]|uniref:O-methyltransferase n=1 Tax=Raoultella sp. BIGb0138 TaxID=2485115 RepID=UPI001FB2503F|nr:class I SAM-dependent methyltransferase [Raoultella sp. BIGb0138]
MNSERKRPAPELFAGSPAHDPEQFADYGFSIHPEQGDLIYLLCRAMKATRVVDFATSVGMSAIYFAAAMRDNGGGKVIGSELVAAKAETARRNLAEAELDAFVDIRLGDARETLKDLGGPVDFVLIDGWPLAEGPTLARQVIEVVAPQLRVGGYVMNDNAEPDFLAYIRDPENGFISLTLPIKRGTELALKIR